jgi:hypothetical protein
MTLLPPTADEQGPRIVAAAAVHLPGRLDREQQRTLVHVFHGWCAGPVSIRAAELSGGRRTGRTLV